MNSFLNDDVVFHSITYAGADMFFLKKKQYNIHWASVSNLYSEAAILRQTESIEIECISGTQAKYNSHIHTMNFATVIKDRHAVRNEAKEIK